MKLRGRLRVKLGVKSKFLFDAIQGRDLGRNLG